MMILLRSDEVPRRCPGAVVTVGNFDGVHLGHQRVLRTAVGMAGARGAPIVAVTFHPHPAQVLTGSAPERLSSDVQQEEALAALGVSALLREPFDSRLAAVEADDFYRTFLRRQLGARGIVVGENFRFGAGRRGTVDLLARLAETEPDGPAVAGVPAVVVEGEAVSSTRVRRALALGDVKLAAALLGRPYALSGRVVRGDGRGRRLGFPTANLETRTMAPAAGVYACATRLSGATHAVACNVGRRPTFGGGDLVVEAHVLGVTRDLYGAQLVLRFLKRIRDERSFDGVDELVAQVGEDVAAAGRCLERVGEEGLGPAGDW